MQSLTFVLNLPWSILGFFLSLLSIPCRVELRKNPPSVIFRVRSFWWYSWLHGKKNTGALTNGYVIQLGPLEKPNDLEHELVHVEQSIRELLIHSLLYMIENMRHGYMENKYEKEAFERAGNRTNSGLSK